MRTRKSDLAVILSQLEVAALDTIGESLIKAVDPREKKSFPRIVLMVMLSTVSGFLISILYMLIKKNFDNTQTIAAERTCWKKLKVATSVNVKQKKNA